MSQATGNTRGARPCKTQDFRLIGPCSWQQAAQERKQKSDDAANDGHGHNTGATNHMLVLVRIAMTQTLAANASAAAQMKMTKAFMARKSNRRGARTTPLFCG
jgi:hypothetical protein